MVWNENVLLKLFPYIISFTFRIPHNPYSEYTAFPCIIYDLPWIVFQTGHVVPPSGIIVLCISSDSHTLEVTLGAMIGLRCPSTLSLASLVPFTRFHFILLFWNQTFTCNKQNTKWLLYNVMYLVFRWNMSWKGSFTKSYIYAMTWLKQQNEYAPSEDSDQPGHPPSLIRVFGVCSVGN